MDIPNPLRASLLAALRRGLSVGDGPVERLLGAPTAVGLLASVLARRYDPSVVPDFEGTIAFELTRPTTAGEPLSIVVEVAGGRARTGGGVDPDHPPALRLVVPIADFARVATGAVDPAEPLLNGRAKAEGDLGLTAQLAEMFGAPQPT